MTLEDFDRAAVTVFDLKLLNKLEPIVKKDRNCVDIKINGNYYLFSPEMQEKLVCFLMDEKKALEEDLASI